MPEGCISFGIVHLSSQDGKKLKWARVEIGREKVKGHGRSLFYMLLVIFYQNKDDINSYCMEVCLFCRWIGWLCCVQCRHSGRCLISRIELHNGGVGVTNLATVTTPMHRTPIYDQKYSATSLYRCWKIPRELQITRQFAADHFEVYLVNNLKNTGRLQFTLQKGADGQLCGYRAVPLYCYMSVRGRSAAGWQLLNSLYIFGVLLG